MRVEGGPRSAVREQAVELRHLRHTDRSLDVGHSEVEAQAVESGHGVGPSRRTLGGTWRRCAVVAKTPHPRGEVLPIGRHHPSFTGRDDLPRMEGEAAHIAEPTHRPALVARADATRRVLDHRKAVAAGSGEDRVHLRRESKQMHRDHRLRPWCDCGLEGLGIEIVRCGVYVGEHSSCAHVLRAVRGGDPGECGDHHLITRAKPEGQDRKMERRRTGGRGQGVGKPMPLRHEFLELARKRALGHPTRVQTAPEEHQFRIVKVRERELHRIHGENLGALDATSRYRVARSAVNAQDGKAIGPPQHAARRARGA